MLRSTAACLVTVTVLAFICVTCTAFNDITYVPVGTVSTSISTSFGTYTGYSIIRCFAICSQISCKMVAWGRTVTGNTDCRVLTGEELPISSQASYDTITRSLSIYALSGNNNLTLIQKSYGLLIVSSTKLTWQDTRAICRNYGLGFFSSTSQADMLDLYGDYGRHWIGTSDTEGEGLFKMDEGTILPSDMWCPGEPSDSAEECAAISSEGCVNDLPCSLLRVGFCNIGK